MEIVPQKKLMPKINESKTEMIGIGHYLREYPEQSLCAGEDALAIQEDNERSFKSNKKR